uniref:Uncharacterized protein n=1 Tax=Rhipicephalus zambeziensis TaxID=60191 RepID=A0A224YEV5_9ACAR
MSCQSLSKPDMSSDSSKATASVSFSLEKEQSFSKCHFFFGWTVAAVFTVLHNKYRKHKEMRTRNDRSGTSPVDSLCLLYLLYYAPTSPRTRFSHSLYCAPFFKTIVLISVNSSIVCFPNCHDCHAHSVLYFCCVWFTPTETVSNAQRKPRRIFRSFAIIVDRCVKIARKTRTRELIPELSRQPVIRLEYTKTRV